MEFDNILFKSSNNNNYLYSYENKQILLIHPIISKFIELKKKGINIKDWINNKNNYESGNHEKFLKKEILYYFNKYNFLFEKKFFESVLPTKRYKYTASDIKYQLANTSQIGFEVTEKCNLNCEYCIYGKYYTNRNKPQNFDLDINTAKNVLNYLSQLWSSSLNSSHNKDISIGFYGGEALVNIDFIHKIVNYTKSLNNKHFNFTFHLTTNGTLLDKHISFLVENNFYIVISLDGGSESNNVYRRFHNGQPAFSKIFSNILEIQKNYPNYFDKKVGFISVLHDKNSFTDIYDFFQNKFNKIPLVSELDQDSVNENLINEFSKMYQSASQSLKKNERNNEFEKLHNVGIVENLTKFLFDYTNYVKTNYLDLLLDNAKHNSKLPTGTCPPFSRKIFITARGQVLPCERIGHQFTLGNVDGNNIKIDYNEISKKYNDYFENICQQCDNCYLNQACGNCMFKEKIESKNFKCSGFTNYKSFADVLSKNISYIEQNPEVYVKILKKLNYI